MYSRANPSPFYRRLLESYAVMHRDGYKTTQAGIDFTGAPEKAYPGNNIKPFVHLIKDLIEKHGARSLLDYGCGKGDQYQWQLVPHPAMPDDATQALTLPAYWGVDVQDIALYEPALGDFDTPLSLPKVDGVICTDVLEHCHMADMPWIMHEIFQTARKFVFINIASYPAKALLPTGENAHISIRPGIWWAGFFDAVASSYPEVDFCLTVDEYQETGDKYRFYLTKPVYNEQSELFSVPLDTNLRVEHLKTVKRQSFSF